jgi:hypothetical protein
VAELFELVVVAQAAIGLLPAFLLLLVFNIQLPLALAAPSGHILALLRVM